jgi:hypothetical protein
LSTVLFVPVFRTLTHTHTHTHTHAHTYTNTHTHTHTCAPLPPPRYILTLVNAEKHGSWMQPFRLPKTVLPSMGIVEVGTDRFFSFLGDPIGTAGTDAELPTLAVGPVVDFVRAYLSGLLAPLPPLDEEGGNGLLELGNSAHNAPKEPARMDL